MVMDGYKLLIADSSEEFCQALAELAVEAGEIRSCRDGKEALEMLRTFQPQLMVLDLMLPGLDGISILHAAQPQQPIVLATTRYTTPYIEDSLSQLSVDYLMVKPCDVQAAAARLKDLSFRLHLPRIQPYDYRTMACQRMLELGLPANLHGYAYLREAIPLCVYNPDQLVTKELYPAVAAICKTDISHVERSMRNVIHKAWSQRDDRVWAKYFPPDAAGFIPRPSNSLFISRLADSLRQEMAGTKQV